MICRANQLTCFYMIETWAFNELNNQILSGSFLELCQTFMMELYVKIMNSFWPLTVFEKSLHHRSLAEL